MSVAGEERPAQATLARPAAVLWDMDGTFVDTEPYWMAAERELVESFGNEWPEHHALAIVGFDLLDAAEYIAHHGGVPLPPEEIVERMLDAVIARMRARIPWRPGARRLLGELHAAGVPCALVTMSWRRLVDELTAQVPPGAFGATIVGDEVPAGMGKPHPEPYRLAAAACGAAPRDCVAVEDSPTGVRSALGAGCRVIGVPNVRTLEPAAGLTIVDSLEHLTLDDLAVERVIERAGAGAIERAGAGAIDRAGATAAAAARRRWATLGGLAAVAIVLLVVAVLRRGGDEGPPPLPPGAVPVDVWAPYWTLTDTLPEASDRFAAVREVSPFWYGARGVTEIAVDAQAPAEAAGELIDAVHDAGRRLVPSIRDEMPAGQMAAILADPGSRSRHVDAIVAFADGLDADGIDLDYEQFAFADDRATWETTRPAWVAFVEELAAALHGDGRTLTVSIPPVYDAASTGDRGYWVYDHGAIAPHVDAIRIMAYDYSVPDPGPIAPLGWVRQVIDGTSLAVPAELHGKLVLGVPSYGTNWVVSTTGTCPASAEGRTNVTARTVGDLLVRRNGVPQYDQVAGEWSFAYDLEVTDGTASCVQSRKVHWVDAEGAAARVEMARRAG